MISIPRSKNAWLSTVWAVITVIGITQTILYKLSTESEQGWMAALRSPVVAALVGLGMIFFWIKPGYELLKKKPTTLKIPLFLLHLVGYEMIALMIFFLFIGFWSGHLSYTWYESFVSEGLISNFHSSAKSYFLFVATIFAYDYFSEREQSILKQKQVENELSKVKINAIEAKLQPHFLFNTLNGIVALIEENTDKAQKALIGLSDLLRFSITLEPETLIEIDQEVELLKKYLMIELIRHEEQLIVEWKIKPSSSGFKIPPLILQPVIENSIKHGFKNLEQPLQIVVEINCELKIVIIKNNGQPLPDYIVEGVGLRIVRQRLQSYFSKDSNIKTYQEGSWVINELAFGQ
ncbi:MAG: histidine kinase [Reichenbachiella sp.]|uniref:sensor histidine kinase n=3 Tax=Reichenbachiella sp. TaxID=2184521 RepID=UPI003265B9E1